MLHRLLRTPARAALGLATCTTLAMAPALAQIAVPSKPAAKPPAEQRQKSPTVIDANVLEGAGGIEVRARGSVELKTDEVNIFADFLRYNQETQEVEASGGVRLEQSGDRYFGSRFLYNLKDDVGVFEQPNYIINRANQTARGGADRLEFLGPNRYRLHNATFTTCAPGKEDWQLVARELELNYDEDEARARGLRLRFFDTTVAGLPFATLPLENKRKSGLLTPYYSQTTTRGAEFGQPIYWNIAPEQDATFTPVYMSKRGLQMKAQYRYLQPNFRGDAGVEFLDNDRILDRSRYGFALLHEYKPSPELYGRLDLNKVSDDRYFVEMHSQVRQVTIGNLQREGYLSYNGRLGETAYSAESRVQSFQTLQDPLAPIVSPYHRLPQLNLSATRNDLGGLLDTRLAGEFTRFSHPQLVEGTRTSFKPVFAAPFLAPSFFFTPKAGLHYARYELDRTLAGQPEQQSISVPWASLDSGLFFERQANWFGNEFTQTLEPRAFYVYAPFVNQSLVPLFDTAQADFNYAQIFNENRFVGGDRFGDANQLTIAVTSRLLDNLGRESLRATLGQRIYFQDEKVALTPASPLRTTRNSDLLASIGGQLGRDWSFDASTQYSVNVNQSERISTSVRYSPEIAKVLNASYRFSRSALRQIDLSGQWPVAQGWYAVGRYNYSFLDNRALESVAGFEYNGGCWVFRAVFQRLQASAQTTSTAFFVQVELNGFGQFGSGNATEFLRRSVPGYSVTNPRDPALAPPGVGARRFEGI